MREYIIIKLKDPDLVEQGMVVTIVLSALVMFYWSFNYASDVAFFPQLTSIIVIGIGSIILIFNSLVNAGDEKSGLSGILPDNSDEKGGYALDSEIKLDEMYLIILTLVYLVVSILFGVMWGTILFILMYSKWQNLSVKTAAIHLMLSTFVVYLFMYYMNIDMMDGYVLGGF